MRYQTDDLIEQSVLKTMINCWMINCEICNNVHEIGNQKCKKYICKICGNDSIYGNKFVYHLENECYYDGIIRTCECCYEKVYKAHLEHHKISECSKRKINCEYCQISIHYDESIKHKASCETQTYSKCETCYKNFTNNVIDLHRLKCKPLKKKDTKNMPRQREINHINRKMADMKNRMRNRLQKM